MKVKFLTAREMSENMGRAKAEMNPVMLDWNWGYHYELLIFNMGIAR